MDRKLVAKELLKIARLLVSEDAHYRKIQKDIRDTITQMRSVRMTNKSTPEEKKKQLDALQAKLDILKVKEAKAKKYVFELTYDGSYEGWVDDEEKINEAIDSNGWDKNKLKVKKIPDPRQ